MIDESEHIKSPTAFKLKIKKKIKSGDKEQLQDFEEWYLTRVCERLKAEYRGTIIINGVSMKIVDIYPYFRTVGYSKSHYIYVGLIDNFDGGRFNIGFDSVEEVERFIEDRISEAPL